LPEEKEKGSKRYNNPFTGEKEKGFQGFENLLQESREVHKKAPRQERRRRDFVIISQRRKGQVQRDVISFSVFDG
jgi:hypothetical protein